MNKTEEEDRITKFKGVVERELKRCTRYQNFASLLMLNVSRDGPMTPVNGSVAISGEKLMALIRSMLRETDVVDLQRDDLITVLLLYSDKRIARQVGDRLKTWISNYFGEKEDPDSPRVYFGGASFPSHATDCEILYQRAFQMVEKAKDSKQSLVQIFD
jgi:hypothetical protein